ncbi:hypothetical protein J3459_009698 [Metarhizium acridum]|nr:hypothetical protein J3459_009698 [Metarhizium acridum]
MPTTEQELFFYNGDGVGCENLANYRPCGLHPVILGDVLPKPGTCVNDEAKKPRYRIAQKLGYGGFSTVWLARDLDEERYVAVKVCRGSDHAVQSNEVTILRQIHRNGLGKPGYTNIIEIHDVFTIRGPNGFHECLVTEVVLPLHSVSVLQNYSPPQVTKQLLRAFDFLHGEGVVHGDPHYANFGIAIPRLQQFDEGAIADYFADPPLIPVVPRDASFPRDSVPSYIAETVPLGSFVLDKKCLPSSEEVCLKVFDFGRACWTDKIDKLPGAAPPTVRPPEVYMHDLSGGRIGSVWSVEADIWAIGCTVSHLIEACMVHICKQIDRHTR